MDTNNTQNTNNDEQKGPAYRHPHVQNFRTLQSDMVDAVKKQDRSLANMVLSAREKVWEKKQTEKEEGLLFLEKVHTKDTYKNSKYKYLLLGLIIMIIALVGLRTYVYDPVENSYPHFITPNISINIVGKETLNTEYMTREVVSSRIKGLATHLTHKEGDTMWINIIKQIEIIDPDTAATSTKIIRVSAREFINLWANDVPGELLFELEKAHYFLGLHSSEGRLWPFLIIIHNNQELLLKKMGLWEQEMFSDTRTLFTKEERLPVGEFKGADLSGIRIRVLEFAPQDPGVLYGSINKSILMLTENTNTFETLSKELR